MQVNVVTDAVNTSGVTSTNRRIAVPDLRLHKDFGTLLERGCFSDVTVVVDDVEFKAHKAVLAGEHITAVMSILGHFALWLMVLNFSNTHTIL